MKITQQLLALSLLLGVIIFTSCNQGGGSFSIPSSNSFGTLDDSISYAIGTDIAKNINGNGIEINVGMLAKGMQDAISGNEALALDEKTVQQMLFSFQTKAQAFQQEKMMAEASENLAKGEAFLTENKDKEGVVVLESGLQYKIINSGKGKSPKATDQVKVHYTGKLIDGTVFDSSYEGGQPVSFPVNQVIPGWTEALQLMKEGDKWMVYIPANLGYGPRGTGGGEIPPNATLVFEVELLEVLSGKDPS